MTGKMAIIGKGDGIIAFASGGIKPFSVENIEKANELINKLAKEYQIIFVTDDIAEQIKETIDKYLTKPYPIIISVPSANGSSGYGMERIKSAMEKALGVDILFSDKKD